MNAQRARPSALHNFLNPSDLAVSETLLTLPTAPVHHKNELAYIHNIILVIPGLGRS